MMIVPRRRQSAFRGRWCDSENGQFRAVPYRPVARGRLLPGDVVSMSLTQGGSTSAAFRATLDAARAELCAAIRRGAGGRAALERYADHVDALLKQVFVDAAPTEVPVGIIALGGYGR